MLMENRYWMALHGAVPVAAILRIETFSHEIAAEVDAVDLWRGRRGRVEWHRAEHLQQAGLGPRACSAIQGRGWWALVDSNH